MYVLMRVMKNANDWGPKIRNRRLRKGLSQEALARLVGVDVRTINRWESGEQRNMRLDAAMKLAFHLDCSMDVLFGQYRPDDDPGRDAIA